jgi:hypothetical protein
MNKNSLILFIVWISLLVQLLADATSSPSLNISKKSKLENGFDKCFCKVS